MIEEACDSDWLSRHLVPARTAGGEGGVTTEEEGGVLVLDCRSLAEYRVRHIVGAIHLTVPMLMLRRLRTGCLPVESVINCQDARERFTRHWKTKTLVLVGDSHDDDRGYETGSAKTVSGCDTEHARCSMRYDTDEGKSRCEAEDTTSLVQLLCHRLKADGCTVRFLRGGFSAFCLLYPELCIASPENETTILGLGCLRLSGSAGGINPSGTDDPSAAASNASSRGPGTENDPGSPDNTSHFPVEVLPNLYLGNAKNSADFENLYKNGIKYILNVTPNVPNKFENSEQFQYLQLPICDHWSQNMTAYFPQAIAFIEEARRKKCGVLVHCLAGISRSVTITVAYLMHSLSLSLNDAYDHVKRCKPNISPNFNFMGQLLDYERTLRLQRNLDVPPSGECCSSASSSSCECRCRLAPPSECRCLTPASADSGAEDLSAPCACADKMVRFSSPAGSSLSSFSTGAASSSSSSSTSSSAFNYEIPPSSHT